MNGIDRKIKKVAKQTNFHPSTQYENRIDSILEEIEMENQLTFVHQNRKSFLRYGVCVFAIVLMVSIPIVAAIDYVKERMRQLDQQEQQMYQKTANSVMPDTEAITYSRDLAEEEQERYQQLWTEYEASGIFPEHELTIVDSVTDNMGANEIMEKELLFENTTRTLYLPDRSLTDEELLEIIDFYCKADYSVQQNELAKEEIEKQKELVDATQAEEAISEEQARALAIQYLRAMFGIEVTGVEVSYSETPGYESDGDYICSYQEKDITYQVVIKAKNAQLTSIDKLQDGIDYYAESAPIDVDYLKEKAQSAKKLFQEIYGENTRIVSITCSYRKDENNHIPRGNAIYYIELEDGSAIRFSYNVNLDTIWQMILFTNYRDMREAEAQGIREVELDRVYISIE